MPVLADSDKVTAKLALLLKRKYQKRKRKYYVCGRSSSKHTVTSSFLNGSYLNRALKSMYLRKRTILPPRRQADSDHQ